LVKGSHFFLSFTKGHPILKFTQLGLCVGFLGFTSSGNRKKKKLSLKRYGIKKRKGPLPAVCRFGRS
jgi:hypothetical protein